MIGDLMGCIKEIRIKGFKKFKNFTMTFNRTTNILVGDNASGKSTILEAINIVINQWYQYGDRSLIVDLFNREEVLAFKEKPCIDTLPQIAIELDFDCDISLKGMEYSGVNHSRPNSKNMALEGIRFVCKINDEYRHQYEAELDKMLHNGDTRDKNSIEVPYEYYELSWTRYDGLPYTRRSKPLRIININTDKSQSKMALYNYNKQLFDNVYNEDEKKEIKNAVRVGINKISKNAFKEIDSSNCRRFDIDPKKTILESIINIYDSDVSLDNQGSGVESKIKIELALSHKKDFDIIQIEEPENHLSFINLRKIIKKIENDNDGIQLIISTHSSMISSHLDLNNVIWINEEQSHSLSNISQDTAKFFKKLPNNYFLQIVLSNKVIIVEGATESILMPYFYRFITEKDIYTDNISIIPCNSVSYERYVEIAKPLKKRVAVITDNDKSERKIEQLKDFNTKSNNIKYFTEQDINNWTWEVCLLNKNKNTLEGLINPKEGCKYLYKSKDVGDSILGYMLNNKVETAYKIVEYIEKGGSIDIPNYLKEAIKWLRK